ncbi:MAG: IS1634 family transposase, partial [Kineothrix sp.]|nr:IS1634 family transposase [Kineothrix sp.]
MRVTTSKSKNSESFYITKGFINEKGVSTSSVVRKLGTLNDLLKDHGPTRDDVMAWAREQAMLETEKYKKENEARTVLIPFHADRQLDYGRQRLYKGGYLFLQSVYYGLGFDRACRKIRERHKFRYDLNAILSDLIYTRILEPGSKRASYRAAMDYLERPSYEEHDVYRALDVLAEECDFIQAEAFKNSSFLTDRNDGILYYDCTNYYFEIEQEDGAKKYGKSKEHRPNPIVQMGMFTDGDGIPLAFSIFPGNQNEQQSLKPLERTVLQKFGHSKFIYCCDAGLGSEGNREFNHMGERSFIVTQSIKKLPAEDREWALNGGGFKRLSDDRPVDLSEIGEEKDGLFYKDCPYTTKKLHQRLIITYSPKYAAYQKEIRRRQVERAEKMVAAGKRKAERKNPNDPARFVGKMAVTKDGEAAGIQYYLDEEKIAEEARYDGLYAVCTDLLDDDVAPILKVSEGRWRIEECFRIMKTDFEARPAFVRLENRIKAHFLTCFLALLVYRILEKKLGGGYTCEEILKTLREMDFADVEDQGYMPLYKRSKLTDVLHEVCGFRTDYQFITRQKMRGIQKRSKG